MFAMFTTFAIATDVAKQRIMSAKYIIICIVF